MRFTILYLLLFVVPFSALSQDFNERYSIQVKAADSLYKITAFKNAAQTYNQAFIENGNWGYLPDRYSAARAWAMANEPDSAFFHLFRIIDRLKYDELEKVENDSSFLSLHSQPHWKTALDKMKKNKLEKKELIAILERVFDDDQRDRLKVEETQKRFGWGSKEMETLNKLIITADSINEIKVTGVLDKYGWPGQYIIGNLGIAIFLVIQHSDLQFQEKYLPLVKKAVADDELDASNLALLEDRIAVGHDNCQIYGTQIGIDDKSKQNYFFPILDPEHVDERRKKMGLGPLSEYADEFKIKWDAGEHKKQIVKLRGRKNDC